jgi:tetratricopeptide (TPR) repeat protein
MRTIKKQAYAAKGQQEQKIEGLMHTVSAMYAQYRRQILFAVTVALAVLVAVGGYSLYQSGNERKASAMLSRAYEYYSPRQAPQPEYGKALELFREVASKYSGTLSAAIARYYAGNCLMNMGQMEGAVKEYQYFVKRHAGEKNLLGLVYQRMGYAYRALGNRDESTRSFEKAEALLGPGLATVELAGLYEEAGNIEEARKKYRMIAEKLPGTGLSEEAKQKIGADSGAPQAAGKEQAK